MVLEQWAKALDRRGIRIGHAQHSVGVSHGDHTDFNGLFTDSNVVAQGLLR